MSASGRRAFGGIGTWPQMPTPPSFTFFDELRLRVRVALVLGRDVDVRRSDDLLVDGVARGAAVLLHQRFGGGVRRCAAPRSAASAATQATTSGEAVMDGSCDALMVDSGSLRTGVDAHRGRRPADASRASARSTSASEAIGGRQVVPRQTHATAPRAGAAPLTSAAGSVDAGRRRDAHVGPVAARERARATRARLRHRRPARTDVGGASSVARGLEQRRIARRASARSPARTARTARSRGLDIARLARRDGRARSAPAPRRRCPTASRCRGPGFVRWNSFSWSWLVKKKPPRSRSSKRASSASASSRAQS